MILTTEHIRGDKLRLLADGDEVAVLEASFWYSQGILEGDDVTEERLAELLLEARFRRAYQAAITQLSHRAHSRKELADKLRMKGHERDACEYALARVEELGLADDEDYAMRLAQSLMDHKGYSFERIRMELRQKGIASDIIENTLEGLDNDPVARMIELLNTRFAASIGSESGRKRAFSALLRLGYDSHDIRVAMREAGENLDSDE